eukprot:TRINITY_DN7563_c0_g1_i1.p1 TRINITY_DN7563_c0_g1~~TRINITY_DN7563_c0_g1_i1.p1  ORF type:complete len:554 (+),score=122.00 TRINITY_DN7563_c0_g1_i1:81-1742(+)
MDKLCRVTKAAVLSSAWLLDGLGAEALAVATPTSGPSSPTSVELDDATDTVRLDSQGAFRDGSGRARVFHGVNVVYKQAPWLPSEGASDFRYSLNDDDAALLRKWGFNVVRFGLMWEGLEPQRDQWDDSYLARFSNFTKRLGKQGVYTLVDMHQDLLARKYCGEGVPAHYVDELLANESSRLSKARPFPQPISNYQFSYDADGNPPLEECPKASSNFGNLYMSETIGALFHELWSPEGNINAGLRRYWKKVAEHFAKEGPQILGYELLNEPSVLCMDGLTSCVPPGAFFNKYESQLMAPLYQRLADEIRATDRDRPIFYEASIYPKAGLDIFQDLPLGSDPQQVFAYHIYCNPGRGVVSDLMCRTMQDNYMRTHMGFVNKYPSLGGFMTEFGAIGENEEDLHNIERLLQMMESNGQSWAYWSFKDFHDFTTMSKEGPLFDEEGNVQMKKLHMLTRTYAPAVAGTPIESKFHPETGKYFLKFEADLSCKLPTEIYLNEELHYKSGFFVEVSPPESLTWEHPEVNRLHFRVKPGLSEKVLTISITSPASSVGIVV